MHKRITIKAWACKCDREPCGHEWTTQGDQLPKVCPACKALTWNQGKRRQPSERQGRGKTGAK